MPKSPERESLSPKALELVPQCVIKVVRRRFRLTLFTREYLDSRTYSPVWSCPIAIGAIGFETPAGVYTVLAKQSPPTYTAPDSAWAREAGFTPGEELPPNHPANPLRGAFLWLNDEGIGIHGTPNLLSLRSKASHGCVRVRPQDAVYLFRTVPLGSVVIVT